MGSQRMKRIKKKWHSNLGLTLKQIDVVIFQHLVPQLQHRGALLVILQDLPLFKLRAFASENNKVVETRIL